MTQQEGRTEPLGVPSYTMDVSRQRSLRVKLATSSVFVLLALSTIVDSFHSIPRSSGLRIPTVTAASSVTRRGPRLCRHRGLQGTDSPKPRRTEEAFSSLQQSADDQNEEGKTLPPVDLDWLLDELDNIGERDGEQSRRNSDEQNARKARERLQNRFRGRTEDRPPPPPVPRVSAREALPGRPGKVLDVYEDEDNYGGNAFEEADRRANLRMAEVIASGGAWASAGRKKERKGKGRSRGRGSRAVADQDLFEDLLGPASRGEEDDDIDGIFGSRLDGSFLRGFGIDAEGWEGQGGDGAGEEAREVGEEEEEPPPPPRPTREVYEEAMAALTPELRQMWTETSRVAGTSKAVTLLQRIIKATPDGQVQPELFQALFKFELDPFQTQALRGLADRKNVIVSAPTGSGKTVVGELAVYYALALNLRVFYTTPLKALSNQKFQDFRRQFGEEKVGLLTGDSSFNRDAQVAVMTTEVFRNMLYDADSEDSDLKNVFAVVFDEFHYMNDRDRGTVWEESVISCPKTVLMVALSATMSNVGEIKDWVQHTHGPSSLVVSDFRPVPLRYWFASRDGLYHLFRDQDSGPGAPNGGREKGEGPTDESRVDGSEKGFTTKAMNRKQRRKRNQLPDRLRLNDDLLRCHENDMASREYLEDQGRSHRYGGGGGADRGRGRGRRGGSRRGSR